MGGLELWGGAECSVVRVGDRVVDQVERTGHGARADDLNRLAVLGVRAFRQPVLWERTAPEGLERADWRWADERLARLRGLGVRPIVGLVHHGSGPRSTSLLDPSFVTGLSDFARAAARRYPWVEDWTPVNEPLTTARFACLYGHWHPHATSARAFVRALLVECAATAAAMRAVREVSPRARLVQTEDFATVFSTPLLAYQARFENQRRFLSLDLLFGRVDGSHPLRGWLTGPGGAAAEELDAFVARPCPPDVVGINYYVTSDRLLDERLDRYPPHTHGGNGRHAYADVEAVRARECGILGHVLALRAVAARYRRPVALTEVHLGCTPDEQIRWLDEAWRAAVEARAGGVDVRGVTVWSAFGAYDWDSLLVLDRRHYEPGLFDVRGPAPRASALAGVVRELATHGKSRHPALATPGWWRHDTRLLYPPVGPRAPKLPVVSSRGAPPLLSTPRG
jgi:dTDP-4-dehydrorhamnose reductase